jgi:hypothetical protein
MIGRVPRLEKHSLEQPFQVLGTLAVVFIALGLWAAISRIRQTAGGFGLAAKNLFLGIRVTAPSMPGSPDAAVTGHVLHLTPREATLVSPQYVRRGDAIELDLGSLPDGPQVGLAASVAQVRTLPGEPQTFLLTVRFAKLPEAAQRPLVQYVRRLAEQGRLAPA